VFPSPPSILTSLAKAEHKNGHLGKWAAPTMRVRVCILVVLAVVVPLALLAYGFFSHTFIGFLMLNQNPGWFHRGRYTQIVERIRAMNLSPGEWHLRLDDVSAPASLRRVGEDETFTRGDGAGCVWAEVKPDGNLKVVIETRDLGHAGEYGFAYSDGPLTMSSMGSDGAWYQVDLPGHLNIVTPDMQIDNHWWKVLYNLD